MFAVTVQDLERGLLCLLTSFNRFMMRYIQPAAHVPDAAMSESSGRSTDNKIATAQNEAYNTVKLSRVI